jgi:L-threonylcarbamoyladenylate synthase
MPGPLTVVLEAKDTVPIGTRGGLSTVAVRCPIHPIAHRLIELSGRPIAAPSANLSGSPSPTSAIHVIDDMSGRIDAIIDGGDADIGLESTIVKIEQDGALTLLRPGGITVDELACIAPVSIADAVTSELKDGEVALSPGMKYRHYAPDAPLVLLDGEICDYVEFIERDRQGRICILSYFEDADVLQNAFPDAHILILGARNNIEEQAKHLFSLLREADKLSFNKIYAPVPSKSGVGLALYNRMIRAAAHTIINLRQERNG